MPNTANAGGRQRVKEMELFSIKTLLTLPEPVWLIEQLFPVGGLVELYGPAGHGKSFVALDWALHIASGRPWQGLPVRQGPVIYVAAEGRGGIAQRVAAWLDYHQIPEPPLFFSLEPLDMLADGPEEVISACLDFASDGEDHPDDLAPALVVIDTLARCFAGGDEDETDDMGLFVRGVDLIRHELQTTVLVVHHAGKDLQKGERGNTALRGAADTIIRAMQHRPKKTILLRCTKQKDAPEFENMELSLLPVGKSCIVSPRWNVERALADVLSGSLISSRAKARRMAELTGLSEEQCRHRIRTAQME